MTDSFSVVIPSRDRPAEVAALVDRIIGLDHAPAEVVVVDDGTIEGALASLERSTGPVRVRVVEGPRRGPASARNAGAAVARGDWLTFLDDDDEPDDDWAATFTRLAATEAAGGRPGHLSIGFRVRRDDTERDMGIDELGPAFADARASTLAGTFALRRDRFEELGGFLDGLRHMEFTELALRLFDRWSPDELGLALDARSHLTIVARPIDDRVSQHPEVLVETGLRLVDATDRLWRRDPRRYADQLATFGVAAARAERFDLARRWLWRAWRLVPRSRHHLARAMVIAAPPLARRVWGGPTKRGVRPGRR